MQRVASLVSRHASLFRQSAVKPCRLMSWAVPKERVVGVSRGGVSLSSIWLSSSLALFSLTVVYSASWAEPPTSIECEAVSKDNSAFRLFAALEAREEMEKVRLAQIIHDLHALAKEERGLRRHVTMATKIVKRNESTVVKEKHPEIGDRISLNGVDLSKLSKEDATRLIEGVAAGSKLEVSSLHSLLASTTELLKKEPNLVDISERNEPVTVVGDLHGSLESLTHILQKVDMDKNVIVFDGDFVDRGQKSLEVLVTLLILKLAHPDRVYLIRGNHEDSMVASVYGFRDEIRQKYGDPATKDIWESIGCLFSALPLALRTKTALVLHGGIPNAEFDLKHLEELPKEARFKMKSIVNPETAEERFLAGIVWSDPTDDDAHAVIENPRGVGILFGSRVAQEFLKRNNLQYLVRGHQVVEKGVQDMSCGPNMSVITVFSAAAYPANAGTNQGAILHLLPDGSHGIESYTVRDISVSNEQLMKETTDQALVKVKSMISCKKSQLQKAFAKVQTAGRVTVDQWVRVMSDTVESAGMSWTMLQPKLAPVSFWYGTISVEEFLKSHSFKLHDSGMQSDDAETLAENQEMLLTVFKFLDTNGDGTLSPKEFRTGVELLNKRLPKERQLKNPDELFKSLDADGNGEISFEEFTNGFGMK